MPTQFDAIVIGTGQSGPAIAHALASKDKKVAIIERNEFGGSCVNFGCIPTKAYVASALAAHYARTADEYGVVLSGDIKVDLKKVRARKDELVAESSDGLENSLRDNDHITVIEGHGRFVGPREVRVDNNGDETYTAETIVINVGARALVPDIEGLKETDYLTATGMLELDDVPEHLGIIGGGYIGLEFAQMFRRFGAKVTIMQSGSHLLDSEDKDISEAIQNLLKEDGVEVLTGAKATSVNKTDNQIEVSLDGGKTVTCSHLLVATGRVPNTDTLGLPETGVETDDNEFIKVDGHLRTSAEGIFAVGDCNGRGAFTHTSYNDFEVLKDHLLGDGRRLITDRIHAHAVYIDPPFARVGITEREARERDGKTLIGKLGMSKVGRAKEMGETHGFMKVLVDENSEQILGASIFGLHGDEVIHQLLDIMYAKKPYTVIRDAVHIHPTVSELVPTMLGKLKSLD